MLFRSRDEAPLTLYPGHLVIMRPEALRLEVYNRFLMLAYRYRNRGVYERAIRITLRAMETTMAEDLRTLASLHLSGLTFSVPYLVFRAYRKLCAGTLTMHDIETLVAKIIVQHAFQRRVGKQSIVFSVTRIQAFAKDIDTRAELEEVVGRNASL